MSGDTVQGFALIIMKASAFDIAEFYQQLRLLVQADMPLPESLRQLGLHTRGRRWNDVVLKMSERAAKGESLSKVMASYPEYFEPLHIKLISAGEKTGTLPDTLSMVASYSRFCQLLADRLREILVYPLLNIHLALVVLLLLSGVVIPRFADIFVDILGGRSLPALTRFILFVGCGIGNHLLAAIVLYLTFLVFSIWILLPGAGPQRMLVAFMNLMPWSGGVAESQDMARLCSLLSMFVWQKMPLHEALSSASQLVLNARLGAAIERVSSGIRAGRGTVEALDSEPRINPMISMSVKRAQESSLSITLAQLAELFERSALHDARRATAVLTVVVTMLMGLVVFGVILAMFLPLITVVKTLGSEWF